VTGIGNDAIAGGSAAAPRQPDRYHNSGVDPGSVRSVR
jgi:hypothetical protein